MTEQKGEIDRLVAATEQDRELRRTGRMKHDPIVRVACPYCGALPGDECVAKSGYGAAHKARRDLAEPSIRPGM